MSLFSENVIPGHHGKTFGTNADENADLERIKSELLSLKGVKDVILNPEAFPKEFTIHTTELVRVQDVEDAVIAAGYHAVPKDLFEL